LAKTIIVDDTPASYECQPENAISVSSWQGDPLDRELQELIAVLRSDYILKSTDVRVGLRSAAKAMADGSFQSKRM
jgi:TFIIF-interacting CTD phosphatase-like protein